MGNTVKIIIYLFRLTTEVSGTIITYFEIIAPLLSGVGLNYKSFIEPVFRPPN